MLTIIVVVLTYLAGIACWICLFRSAAAADHVWEEGPGDLDWTGAFEVEDQRCSAPVPSFQGTAARLHAGSSS